MEFRHIQYFVAVAEELHFGRAAKRLNMSQPPLSQQIAQLEKELGVELFYRTKRSTELTPAGKFFLEQSYDIMNKLDRTIMDVRKIHQGEKGQLIIGYTGFLNKLILNLIRTYRSRYPKVEVVLQFLSSVNQFQYLYDNKIKLGFVCPPIDSSILNSRLVGYAPFVAALPSSHPLAMDTSPLDIKELKNEPFVMTHRKNEPGYYDTIISICNRAGFSPNVIQEAEGIFTILTLISTGLGVSLVTNMALDYGNPGVVFRPLIDDTATMDLSLAWRKNEDSPLVDTFLGVYDELFKEVNNLS
ncbi:LysR family transcriptional regulator [Bacillus sp. EB106-08-02-XG196]|jgi:DNA-binding transcriptional LysR family regulator|uniref:LysR family transcriptional regulator n=1 Tax=Bacillus sp. EB106-08-02-XG196 TaxID=2737049 RepID=UPI0015C48F1F|nr:LysR family transcriptional regulator [Bacillus sp. EB106-08-02-XG196]NWQ42564.1 LysR family transcriptional regulator [Bacillus sp. EB106-08-02-XG196]